MNAVQRIVLSALGTVSAVVLMFAYHTSTAGPLPTSSDTSVVSGTVAGAGTTPAGGTSSGSVPGSSTVLGDVAQTRWGPVQVEITVSGSRITAVDVVDYPSSNGHDVQINSYALPQLVDETLQAQSADIDMVSGATVTSVGYQQSLQSAIDEAGL